MRRTFTIAAVTAGLLLTACGSDGDNGGDLTESQAAAAESAISSAAEDGITLDEGCVNDIAGQLTEEDAVLAAGEDDAELSPEGEALTVQLLSCADEGEIIDLFIEGLSETGPPLDEDCARSELEAFDVVEILTAAGNGDEPPQDLIDALTPCFGG
jgi:hypothetical protein